MKACPIKTLDSTTIFGPGQNGATNKRRSTSQRTVSRTPGCELLPWHPTLMGLDVRGRSKEDSPLSSATQTDPLSLPHHFEVESPFPRPISATNECLLPDPDVQDVNFAGPRQTTQISCVSLCEKVRRGRITWSKSFTLLFS